MVYVVVPYFACVVQLKNAPDFTKVKVNAPIYKGSGNIEPSEERSQKQDKATHAYAKVLSIHHGLTCQLLSLVIALNSQLSVLSYSVLTYRGVKCCKHNAL